MEEITPRDHQVEAVESLRDALASGHRAQAHMCCGSGKTYIQAFLSQYTIKASEDLGNVVVVCFVPNRALIHQNARSFKKVFGKSVEYLGVCSQMDLSGIVALEDITSMETTTDPQKITAFLKRRARPRIVISTYQSAPTLQAAFLAARGLDAVIDLGLFDEAHRTAGNKEEGDLFAFALSDENFKIKDRAFFTATPRIVQSKKGPAISMSDPGVYGPVAYSYPFSKGIEDGNVVDYDLWVPVITQSELAAFMKEEDLDGDVREAVAMIALQKVMEKTGQTRFLSYHNRISSSKKFAKALSKISAFKKTLVAHVDGATPGALREKLMQALEKGRTILTNCKAFVEGVDAPGLQGALFVDRRKSVVDVVQAVGRLSRPDPNDPFKRGAVIAPILTPSLDPAVLARAAATSGFSTLLEVTQALRANDDALEEDILQRSRAIGRGDAEIKPLHNLQVVGAEGFDVEVLTQAITVATLQDLKDDFATRVGEMEKHIERYGYLPTKQSDPRLHAWMTSVRKKHVEGKLEPVHANLLDDVPFWSWTAERTSPEKIAAHILAFKRRKGIPSRKGQPAETDLYAHLMEAQEDFLRNKPTRLLEALKESNVLFFGEEVLGKRAHQSGQFKVVENEKIVFIPRLDKNRKTVPVFRSGHTVPPRPIVVHVGREERERLQALSPRHSVRITLVRAGLDQDPFRDGRILGWHAATVARGETPDTPKTGLTWLLGRLRDRKVSGLPAYTLANVKDKFISPKRPATVLHPDAPPGTIEEVLEVIARARAAGLEGKLSSAQLHALDTAPGFSWIEKGEDVEKVVAFLRARHPEDILHSHAARLSDTGLANTLSYLDALVEDDVVVW